jgi:glucose dehydrogenase
VAAVWLAFARGPATTERLVRHAAAAVVAFVALSKVLSPQFLVWLLLLVPLVGGLRSRAALWLFALACALTAVWFPALYWELVREFDPLASWLVLARGVTLIALLVVLVTPATERARARSRLPAPSAGRT